MFFRKNLMIIGAQLYSVRDKFKNNIETYSTLKTIKNIGYKSIQVSGFPYDAKTIRSYADELDLHIGLTHTSLNEIINNTDKVIADHLILGADVVGLGYPHGYVNTTTGEITDIKALISDLKEPVQKLNDAGLLFGYHNHSSEFKSVDGIKPIDYIFNETSWQIIFDVGWCDFAGEDTVAYINKLNKRLKYVHLKDFRKPLNDNEPPSERIVPIYSGETPIDEIMIALEKNNVYAVYVEQDTAPNAQNSLDEMKKSINALKIKGWIK